MACWAVHPSRPAMVLALAQTIIHTISSTTGLPVLLANKGASTHCLRVKGNVHWRAWSALLKALAVVQWCWWPLRLHCTRLQAYHMQASTSITRGARNGLEPLVENSCWVVCDEGKQQLWAASCWGLLPVGGAGAQPGACWQRAGAISVSFQASGKRVRHG